MIVPLPFDCVFLAFLGGGIIVTLGVVSLACPLGCPDDDVFRHGFDDSADLGNDLGRGQLAGRRLGDKRRRHRSPDGRLEGSRRAERERQIVHLSINRSFAGHNTQNKV